MRAYNSYLSLAGEVAARGLDASISVKSSTLGGTVNRDLTLRLGRNICEKARDLKVGFELDIEGQRMINTTLELAEGCARSGLPVTVALQAYLNRTPQDIERMVDAGVRIRLVKGAYTGDISDFDTISEVYRDLVEDIISYDVPFCVATHDPDILRWVTNRCRDKELIEFGFLKGLADQTKMALVSEGWEVTEYVPFGTEKEGYESRRRTYMKKLEELGRSPAP